MKPVPMEIVSRTHTGRVRKHNEDSVAVLPEHGVAVVADGMGGYNAGEIASRLVVERVAKEIVRRQMIGAVIDKEATQEAILASNHAIFDAIAENPSYGGMGTTVVVALFFDDRIIYGHIGDSRLYRISDGEIVQMTSDHSMVQELVNQGMFFSVEEARRAGVPTNVLTRGLGVEIEVHPDIAESTLAPNDVYLLCSDGLTNMVSDDIIIAVVVAADGDLEAAADRLLERALAEGGIDNITLVLARPKAGA